MQVEPHVLTDWLLGLATTASTVSVGALVYLHVRFARVETILSHPDMGVLALLKDVARRVTALEDAKRR